MKALISQSRLLAAAGAFSLLAVGHSLAGDAGQTTTAQPLILSGPQTEATTTLTTTTAVSAEAAPARLPYGVDEILKLWRAHIGEEIIINYIQNTGTAYNLGPNEIVYLKSQGVSDRVVSAMLDQRRRVAAEAAAQAAAQSAAAQNAAPAVDPNAYSAPAPGYAPGYDQAPPAGVQSAPSTVYTIPSDQSAYAYYGSPYYYGGYPYSYPYYYGGYYGYGPVVNFGFGFGGHYHGGGGFRGGGGGFHGGGIRAGGGFHGGGGHR